MKKDWWLLIWHVLYQFSVFFSQLKRWGIIKIHFGHCVGKFGPWYWITPYLFARIGPLQRGVVLVYSIFFSITRKGTHNDAETRFFFSIHVPGSYLFITYLKIIITNLKLVYINSKPLFENDNKKLKMYCNLINTLSPHRYTVKTKCEMMWFPCKFTATAGWYFTI